MSLELWLLQSGHDAFSFAHQSSVDMTHHRTASSVSENNSIKSEIDLIAHLNSSENGRDSPIDEFNFKDIPLASALVDFFNVVYFEASIVTSIYTVLFKALFGRIVERYVVLLVQQRRPEFDRCEHGLAVIYIQHCTITVISAMLSLQHGFVIILVLLIVYQI